MYLFNTSSQPKKEKQPGVDFAVPEPLPDPVETTDSLPDVFPFPEVFFSFPLILDDTAASR